MSLWCDLCDDHFDLDHFENGEHREGSDFGPVGRELELKRSIREGLERAARDQATAAWYAFIDPFDVAELVGAKRFLEEEAS